MIPIKNFLREYDITDQTVVDVRAPRNHIMGPWTTQARLSPEPNGMSLDFMCSTSDVGPIGASKSCAY